MKKTKNRFVLGFILGMLAMAIVVGGIGVGLYASKVNETKTVSDVTKQKADLLEKIIEAYYLDDINEEDLESGVYKGLVSGLKDPYSVYYTAEEYAQLQESTSGNYCGIGAVVSQAKDTGVITIVRPFSGSPAEKAGAKKNDILYKVEGEEVTGIDIDKVVLKLKGDEGTTVNITVYRPSTKEYIDMSVVRRNIEVPTVEYKMLDEKAKIGYVQIVEFDDITEKQFGEAINSLKGQGAKGIIFDLRDNPGGNYNVGCNMLDSLLPEGTIVSTKDKYDREEKVESDKEELGLPMVVIQNENSASASEIFAGAIQDFKAGKIVGTRSFGKGIVQNLIPLGDGSAIKITVEKYYTPSGKNIHGSGILPDVEVEYDETAKTDTQLTKAMQLILTMITK